MNPDILRIINNTLILLENGSFPGREAAALVESIQFLRNMATDIEAKQQPKPAKKARKGAPE